MLASLMDMCRSRRLGCLPIRSGEGALSNRMINDVTLAFDDVLASIAELQLTIGFIRAVFHAVHLIE